MLVLLERRSELSPVIRADDYALVDDLQTVLCSTEEPDEVRALSGRVEAMALRSEYERTPDDDPGRKAMLRKRIDDFISTSRGLKHGALLSSSLSNSIDSVLGEYRERGYKSQ